VNEKAIPAELRQLPRWACWKQTGKGKVPLDPRTGRHASCTDPATWATFDMAMAAVRSGRYHGLLIALDGDGIVGIDLDDCRDPETGALDPQAAEIIARFVNLEDEFSRVLANMRREGNILSQVIRSCYDNGNLATLTVNPRQAAGAHISITGHITPEELNNRLPSVEMANGFGNRFLWFVVKSDKVMPHTKPIPPEAFEPFVPRLQALRHFATINHADQPVELDPAAKDLWAVVYPRLREDRPGLAGAMVSRGSAMVLRLALIYALLGCKLRKTMGLETIDVAELAVQVADLEAALAVWDYCELSAHMLFASRTGDPLGDKILALLQDGPMTRDEFNRHLSAKQKGALGAVLGMLESANLIRKSKVPHEGAGRPAERWELIESQR
jgi:hypothetical protein